MYIKYTVFSETSNPIGDLPIIIIVSDMQQNKENFKTRKWTADFVY